MGNHVAKLVLPGVPASASIEEVEDRGWVHVKLDNTHAICSPNLETCNFITVFSHGNSEDITSCIGYHACVSDALGSATIGYEYTGYGWLWSKQTPTEAQLVRDTEEACEFALIYANVLKVPLVLTGRSLGCACALAGALYLDHACKAVVLQAPFVSALRVRLPSYISNFMTRSGLDMFQNDVRIKRLVESTALIVFHGRLDKVISPSHGKALFEMAKQIRTRELHFLDSGHNDMCSREDASERLRDALRLFFQNSLRL